MRAAKFPPLGDRSAAGPLPHLHYRSFPAAEADAALNDATLLMVQFESDEAVAKADEIAAVDGVDMVMIGSNDLLADWGLAGQYEHPRLREAYARDHRRLPQATASMSASAGCRRGRELAAEFVRMGARYVSTGTDLGFLAGGLPPRRRRRCGRSS